MGVLVLSSISPIVRCLSLLTLITFHVARDPILFPSPDLIQVHIRFAVACLLIHIVGEVLCIFIGVTKKIDA